MYKIKETSLDWALKHLTKYYDSDFFPRSFEFKALSHNWGIVKKHISDIDLEKHVPKSPV